MRGRAAVRRLGGPGVDHARGGARASSPRAQARGRRPARHRLRAEVRDRPAGASGAGGRRVGPQRALGLHQPDRRRGGARGRGAGRPRGDRDLTPALLRVDGRMEPGVRRRPDLSARRGATVGHAAGPGDRVLGRRAPGDRRGPHPAAPGRALSGRAGAALGRRRRWPRRAAHRRHPAGGAGPPVRQLHVQLPQLRSAPGCDRAAHGRSARALPVRAGVRRLVRRSGARDAKAAVRRSADRYIEALETG